MLNGHREQALRQGLTWRLAAAAGLPAGQQTAVFYVSLLAWVGCVSDSHELAAWFGDDLRLRADSYEVDKAGLRGDAQVIPMGCTVMIFRCRPG